MSHDEYDVHMWCDGSSDGKSGGVGGWAFVLVHPASGHTLEGSGAEPGATNNRMELWSAVKGLIAIKKPCAVVVYSDSMNVVNTGNKWMYSWHARGWTKPDGSGVKNLDIVRRLYDEVRRVVNVTFVWVKGHDTDARNARCDELAVAARAAGASAAAVS